MYLLNKIKTERWKEEQAEIMDNNCKPKTPRTKRQQSHCRAPQAKGFPTRASVFYMHTCISLSVLSVELGAGEEPRDRKAVSSPYQPALDTGVCFHFVFTIVEQNEFSILTHI